MNLYIGIDPSINSTGITVSYNDNEKFYIVKPNKLTKKEQKIHDDIVIPLRYVLYDKIESNDTHEQELDKTYNLIDITYKIYDIVCENIDKSNLYDLYIGIEGISYGSSLRTKSVFDLAGLNYLIRNMVLNIKDKLDNINSVKLNIFPPAEVKKFATGIGNCTKDAIVGLFLNINDKLKEVPKIDDVADSWFICNMAKN